MAKATLTLENGTTVLIEGSAEEVKELLDSFSSNNTPVKKNSSGKRRRATGGAEGKKKSNKQGPVDLIRYLIQEDYFKANKRSLSDIQKKLEERGHIYAQTSLSTPLTRLTRSQELRRLKEKKGWVYTT
jgi:hypothetical protein